MLAAGPDKPALVFLRGFQSTSPYFQRPARVLASTEHTKKTRTKTFLLYNLTQRSCNSLDFKEE